MSTEGKNAPLGLDDIAEEQQSDERHGRDCDGVPYCRKHHCRMKLRSGAAKNKGKDYYGCPVAGCDEKGTRIRTAVETIVPPAPQACPRCSTEKKQVFCERHDKRSTATGVVLTCPDCGWTAGMFAVPHLEAVRLERPKTVPVANVGDR